MNAPNVTELVDALEHTLRATAELARGLDVAAWRRASRCPGWDVHDLVAHLIAIEEQLAGDPVPPPAPAAAHVRDDFGALTERGVHALRDVPGPELAARLENAVDRRTAQLRALDGDPEVAGILGTPVRLSAMLPIRVFDAWAHEQDVRVAVDRPGNLDSVAARICQRQIVAGLPFLVAKRAGAVPGQSVRLDVTGDLPLSVNVTVGPDGRAAPVDDVADPTVVVRLAWPDLVARACGRAGADGTDVEISGDTTLGERLVAALAVTP